MRSRGPAPIVGVDAASLDEAAAHSPRRRTRRGAHRDGLRTRRRRHQRRRRRLHLHSQGSPLLQPAHLSRREPRDGRSSSPTSVRSHAASRSTSGPARSRSCCRARRTCPVSDLATAGLPSIGLRVPQHIATLEIIRRVGRPLAAPSANPSEALSPTTAAHVAAGLGARIDLIVDGGACSAGVESTIMAPGEERRRAAPSGRHRTRRYRVVHRPAALSRGLRRGRRAGHDEASLRPPRAPPTRCEQRLRVERRSSPSGRRLRVFHLLSTYRFAATSPRPRRTSSRCCARSMRVTTAIAVQTIPASRTRRGNQRSLAKRYSTHARVWCMTEFVESDFRSEMTQLQWVRVR